MALMIPGNINYYNYTESEKKFYKAAKALDDSFIVFYSVPWQKTNDSGSFFGDRECDFIIEKKDQGFITVEVKGGKGIRIRNNEWYLLLEPNEGSDCDEYNSANHEFVRKLHRSPAVQAKESMYFFVQHFNAKYHREYSGIFGHAICFTNFSIPDDLGADAPKEIIIDAFDLNSLAKKITAVFNYYRRDGKYREQDSNDFRALIKLKRHYQITKGMLVKNREELFDAVNQVQDLYLSLVNGYKRALISGGAGTGKTFLAIKKAKGLAAANMKVLLLCFTRQLAEHINLNHIQGCKSIDCFNYHEYIKQIIGLEKYKSMFTETSGSMEGITQLLQGPKYKLPKYDAIIIDEGQDFEDIWYKSISLLFKNTEEGIFYVFYDSNQDIFTGKIDRIKHYFHNPPFYLVQNLRNCSEIQKWTTGRTNLGLDVLPSQIEGVEPMVYEASIIQIGELLQSILASLVEKEDLSVSQIVLLSDRKFENSFLKDHKTIGKFLIRHGNEAITLHPFSLRFTTVHAFKGLESDVIIYLQHDDERKDGANRINYVAYTRARYVLYVIKCK